jgi:hypothetical protein
LVFEVLEHAEGDFWAVLVRLKYEYANCCVYATLCIEMAQERLFDLLPGRTDMLMGWAFLWLSPKAHRTAELTPRIPQIFPPPRFGPSDPAYKSGRVARHPRLDRIFTS